MASMAHCVPVRRFVIIISLVAGWLLLSLLTFRSIHLSCLRPTYNWSIRTFLLRLLVTRCLFLTARLNLSCDFRVLRVTWPFSTEALSGHSLLSSLAAFLPGQRWQPETGDTIFCNCQNAGWRCQCGQRGAGLSADYWTSSRIFYREIIIIIKC